MIRPLIERTERFILNHLDSASTMLVAMGIIGTVTSSIAQQIGIKANNTLPKETKEYLVNQEKKDCLLSAGLTWLTGTGSKKIVNALTDRGYLLNNNVRTITDEIAAAQGMTHRELAKAGFFKKFKDAMPQLNIYQKTLNGQNLKPVRTHFLRCREGLSVLAAVGAAILTTNLIVPILRNKLAKPPKKQEKPATLTTYIAQKPAQKLMMTYQPTFSSPRMKV